MVATRLGELVSIVPQDQSFHKLQQVLDSLGVLDRSTQGLTVGLSGDQTDQSRPLGHLPHQGSGIGSLK